ncbi:MAG: RsmD family RNA methyltransferase [Thermomicrobiales bacterium]
MRVISGSARGHRLIGPPSAQTRPMADKIREALFSSLASLGAEPVNLLDLYAGTGSIGIEALSRGAEHVDFVDHQRAACAVIRENLQRTHFSEQGAVHCYPVDQVYRRMRGSYDLIVLDPPYADPTIEAQLRQLGRSTLVQSQGLVVLGHWPRLSLPEEIGRLSLLRRRCHGDSCFSIYAVGDEERPDVVTSEAPAS